jgi:hypothetical protein
MADSSIYPISEDVDIIVYFVFAEAFFITIKNFSLRIIGK